MNKSMNHRIKQLGWGSKEGARTSTWQGEEVLKEGEAKGGGGGGGIAEGVGEERRSRGIGRGRHCAWRHAGQGKEDGSLRGRSQADDNHSGKTNAQGEGKARERERRRAGPAAQRRKEAEGPVQGGAAKEGKATHAHTHTLRLSLPRSLH